MGAVDFCLVTQLPISEVQNRIESLGVKIEVGPIEREGQKKDDVDLFSRS